jgi:serine/threonine protein kinase/Tol biopolymer transport system component
MALSVGDKLGPYEVLAPIGAGGMGEVYRARDSRLGRDVAIKTSAERFNERFEREARAIAALNHPNICHVYDVGENYLVMELIEGESPQGPLPLETVLNYARQIAEALDAAHEKGIVHRDLKPGNIKITPDGTVKVLDFGLAKVGGISKPQSDDSPTITMAATEAGMILGTAAYMSPEQARGKAVDKRADIWAFGVVLYELFTGKRPFGGETLTDTFVSVVKEDPDWNLVPAQVRGLVRRCLEKDPKRRLRDIGDAMLLLDAQQSPAAAAVPPPAKAATLWPRLAVAFAILVTIALIALAIVHFRPAPAAATVRFKASLPDNVSFADIGSIALSPNGNKLAFVGSSSDGATRVWVRNLDSLDAQPVPGSETIATSVPLFWSPDGRFLAFQAGGKLKKIDASGGAVQTICDAASELDEGSWNRDGVIIFSLGGHVMRVSDAGGTPSDLTSPDTSRAETAHLWPTFLPDGKHFLYERQSTKPEYAGFYVGSLDAKPQEQDKKRVLAAGYQPVYSPPSGSGTGHLLFLREGTLFAQPFDAGKIELSGEPVPIAEQIGSIGQLGYFSASANGALAYRAGGAQIVNYQLTWFNRKGEQAGTPGEPGRYGTVKLSPDGKRAAVVRVDSDNPDVWVIDLSSGGSSRFTFDPASDGQPVWSADGSQIAWISNRGGGTGIYRKASNGAGGDELLYKSNGPSMTLTDWSRDGRFIIYHSVSPQTKSDIWALPVGPDSNGDRKPIPVIQTPAVELGGYLSPDSRWIAYLSDESGRQELYVQPFNPTSQSGATQISGKWMVSRGSQGMARWSADGKELAFINTAGELMSVDVTANPVFQASPPKLLFPLPRAFRSESGNPGARADAARDLQRFLLSIPAKQTTRQEMTVVLNWQSALR